jgi:hypothetical protein
MENFIGNFSAAYTPEFCQRVIDFFDQAEEAGFTQSRKQREGVTRTTKDDESLIAPDYLDLRSSELYQQFMTVFWQQFYPMYADRFDVLLASEPQHIFELKVQKTKVGQGYHAWHYESSGRQTANRTMAFTLFLNSVDDGGELEFLYYPKRIKAETGTLLLWPAGFTHTHRGNPPLSNTKYILTGWIEF